ncbi:hypothetical protein [Candidatus Poriferisodalis sp.]|uniref:hypothetical protein n=1 Tax=Candidatus Poriferisodalis sp. TaxID=3101277 RepID=UPI003B51EDF1
MKGFHRRCDALAETVVGSTVLDVAPYGAGLAGRTAGSRVPIVPRVRHHVEPDASAEFYVQFYEPS